MRVRFDGVEGTFGRRKRFIQTPESRIPKPGNIDSTRPGLLSPTAMQMAVDIGEKLGREDENGRKVGSFWQSSAHAVKVMIDGWYKLQAKLRQESNLAV